MLEQVPDVNEAVRKDAGKRIKKENCFTQEAGVTFMILFVITICSFILLLNSILFCLWMCTMLGYCFQRCLQRLT